MQNIVINMREKFHNDRLRNDRALGNRKSDNNKNNTRRREALIALGDSFPSPVNRIMPFSHRCRRSVNFRGTKFLPEKYVLIISKMSEFYKILARKIIKIPEFL